MNSLKIIVMNLEGAEIISKDPEKYKEVFLISIRDTDQPVAYCEIQKNRGNFKRVLPLYFDDIRQPIQGLSMPCECHVRQAIEESRDESKIIVHCTAGVSRSAAIAYCVACSKMDPKDAVKYIDPRYHWPNKTIVRYGEKILGKADMFNVLAEYLDKFMEENDSGWGLTPYAKYP